jgi:phosphoribosylaminoimidazole (AIR) synthetase
VFEWLGRHVDEAELRNVFNLGIGYCAVVPAAESARELTIGEIR